MKFRAVAGKDADLLPSLSSRSTLTRELSMPSSGMVGHVTLGAVEFVLGHLALGGFVLASTFETGYRGAFLCKMRALASITFQGADGMYCRRGRGQPQFELSHYISEIVEIKRQCDHNT